MQVIKDADKEISAVLPITTFAPAAIKSPNIAYIDKSVALSVVVILLFSISRIIGEIIAELPHKSIMDNTVKTALEVKTSVVQQIPIIKYKIWILLFFPSLLLNL